MGLLNSIGIGLGAAAEAAKPFILNMQQAELMKQRDDRLAELMAERDDKQFGRGETAAENQATRLETSQINKEARVVEAEAKQYQLDKDRLPEKISQQREIAIAAAKTQVDVAIEQGNNKALLAAKAALKAAEQQLPGEAAKTQAEIKVLNAKARNYDAASKADNAGTGKIPEVVKEQVKDLQAQRKDAQAAMNEAFGEPEKAVFKKEIDGYNKKIETLLSGNAKTTAGSDQDPLGAAIQRHQKKTEIPTRTTHGLIGQR